LVIRAQFPPPPFFHERGALCLHASFPSKFLLQNFFCPLVYISAFLLVGVIYFLPQSDRQWRFFFPFILAAPPHPFRGSSLLLPRFTVFSPFRHRTRPEAFQLFSPQWRTPFLNSLMWISFLVIPSNRPTPPCRQDGLFPQSESQEDYGFTASPKVVDPL